MKLTVSASVLWVLSELRKAGYQAYLVGGSVRDLLLNQPGTDFDFTTNATPEQIQQVFPESFYENTFGTVSLKEESIHAAANIQPTPSRPKPQPTQRLIDLASATKVHESLPVHTHSSEEAETYEQPHLQITTFRTEGTYSDHRRPESVNWGKTLEEDVSRRDFTINALALSVKPKALEAINLTQSALYQLEPDDYELHDFHHGLDDLHAGIINTVGEPTARFQEDALRLLRAVRFSVQLNFRIKDDVFNAIQSSAALLTHISGERIRDELLKMLESDFPAEGVELLDQAGLLKFILPELLECKGVEQGGHHTTDVWTHSLDSLRECPSPDPIVRLATLIHDIAKPQTFGRSTATITFYNHEIIGSRLAKQIGQRLKLSKHDIDRLFILVRYHMFHYQPENTDAAIRRFMRKVGLENIDDILDLREADRLGSGARKTSWRLEEMKQRMIEQLNQPMEVKDLAINGHDLMKECHLKPGPEIGRVLNQLFEEVLENPSLNQRETLLKKAAELAKQEL